MLFNKKKIILIEKIYQNIIERSRLKSFYLDQGVEDTFESRFDLIILHSFIIFQYFREVKGKSSSIPQHLFDFMFNDFENNLREMGFGDIAVNKKMKVFISAFYGRISCYSKGIEMFNSSGNKELLFKGIADNVYKDQNQSSISINFFIDYLIQNIRYFLSKEFDENVSSLFSFINLDQITISEIE